MAAGLAVALALAAAGCGGGGSGTGATQAGVEGGAGGSSQSAATQASTPTEVIPPGGPDPQAGVGLARVPTLGVVLVDQTKKTLYRFSKDVRGSGETHCYGECAQVWRPKASYEPPAAESPGLDESGFGTIDRKDGYRQATYDGWPLYTYIKEYGRKSKGAGRHSFGGTWYALRANGTSVK